MKPKIPLRDPVAAHRRKVSAARRVGIDARCSCGEARPEALISRIKPTICAECQRTATGRTTTDGHHFAGEANSPITVEVPVNDHRAHLSVAQADWPKSTLSNASSSPLLAAAGCVRGFVDTVLYLIEHGLHWIAEMLEALDRILVKKLGPKWWIGTEIQQFAPRKTRTHGQSGN